MKNGSCAPKGKALGEKDTTDPEGTAKTKSSRGLSTGITRGTTVGMHSGVDLATDGNAIK